MHPEQRTVQPTYIYRRNDRQCTANNCHYSTHHIHVKHSGSFCLGTMLRFLRTRALNSMTVIGDKQIKGYGQFISQRTNADSTQNHSAFPETPMLRLPIIGCCLCQQTQGHAKNILRLEESGLSPF